MKNKKTSMIKILGKIFVQAIRQGKVSYIIVFILGLILSFSMYFQIRIPEIATNVAYAFITDSDLGFLPTIMPFINLIFIILIFTILQSIYSVLEIYVRKKLKTEFELGLTKKLSSMTWESYETHEVNMKIEMVKRDGMNSYQDLTFGLVKWIINTIFFMGIYIYIIGRIRPLVGVLFTLFSVIYMFIGFYCGNKIYTTYRRNDAIYKRRSYLYRCSRSKEAHQDGIINRLYGHLSSRWRKMNDDWSNDSIKATTRASRYALIPGLVFALMAIGLLYLVVLEIQAGRQEIGYFTLIITTLMNYRWTLQGISSSLSWYERDFNVYKDYLDLMAVEEEKKNDERVLPDDFQIDFNNIYYTYPQSEHEALNNLNLQINAHDVIAIVGINGSGKTTFVNMLMELSKSYEGDVIVNQENLNDSLGILRNSCSCIFQDFLEYQFTIKENIALGDSSREIDDEEIWDVLKSVGLDEFVRGLPEGINTVLGQINKGIELSKGQWQRLAVARLLVDKDAKIWILDEPTAYLDPIGEIDMYNFIYDLKGDRTVLFISHRLGFAKKANRIIVFKD